MSKRHSKRIIFVSARAYRICLGIICFVYDAADVNTVLQNTTL
jgi:hypothetical protein